MRYSCLACGWFFETLNLPQICPYCYDRYLVDNIDPNIPPALGQYKVECHGCHTIFTLESLSDWHLTCPICLHEHNSLTIHYTGKIIESFENYQLQKLLEGDLL